MKIAGTIKLNPILENDCCKKQKINPESDFKFELAKADEKILSEEKLNSIRLDFDDGGYCIKQEDQLGRLVKTETFDASGSLVDYIDIVYNPDGTSVQTCKKADEKVSQVTMSNSNGQVVYNTWYNEDGSIRETAEYIYDKDTEIIITRNSYGEISSTWGYETSSNRVLFKTEYDTARKMWSTTNYEYLEDDSSKETVIYENGWKAVETYRNVQGFETETICYDENGELLETSNSFYCTNGESFKIVVDKDGKFICAQSFEKNGNLQFDFKANNASVADYEKLLSIIDAYSLEISDKMLNLTPPSFPIVEDFISEEDYNKILDNYNKNVEIYDKKIADFNKQMNKLELFYNVCSEQKNSLEFDNKITNFVEDIEIASPTGVTEDIAEQIKSHVDNFKSTVEEKINIHNKISKTQAELLNMVVPMPPKASGCKTEEEYQNLYQIYETKFKEYSSIKNELELEIEIQRKRAEVLNMIMSLLYSKEEEKQFS